MGTKGSKNTNKDIKEKKEPKKIKEEQLTRNSFEFLNIIGKGGFGKVWKVYSRKYKSFYAMKEMSKAKIIDKNCEKSVKGERDFLAKMHHPFIINMHFAFQDTDNLYIAMDYLTGGDLRYHLCKNKKFNEQQTKFFIGCIILSLEYIHTNHILHRDLKPENLVLDDKSYAKLTDFGIAKIYQKENYKETSGTPGYMAPEVMKAQNHTIAVDYFALGVIAYEFMKGVRPYLGKNRREIKEKILSKQVQIKMNEIPNGWSIESADFVNKLLQRKPANRLGLRGPAEVKEHPWFKDYPWEELYLQKMDAPFKAVGKENFDYKYCNAPDKVGQATQERYCNIILSRKYLEIFKEYYYFNRYGQIENQENDYMRCFVFKNPHEKYTENHTSSNTEKNMSLNSYGNKTSENDTNSYGIGSKISSNHSNSSNSVFVGNTGISSNSSRTRIRSGIDYPRNGNRSILSNNSRYGINEERFASIRQLPSSQSSKILLKEYRYGNKGMHRNASAASLSKNTKRDSFCSNMSSASNHFPIQSPKFCMKNYD